jgi:tetratricopeptide (TPR) repeat protein
MKTLLLSGALTLAFIPWSAGAQVMTVTGSAGQSCYHSALDRRHDAEAIAECTEALDQSSMTGSDRAGTFVNRGILYMLAGEQDRALRDYNQAIALDPSQAEAWLNEAVTMVNDGKGSTAIDLADRSLRLRTQKPALAYYVRGLGHEEEGQTVAAYDDLRKAEALDPKWNEPAEQLKRYHVVER